MSGLRNPYELLDEQRNAPPPKPTRGQMARYIAACEAEEMDRDSLVQDYIENRQRSIDEYDKQDLIEVRYYALLKQAIAAKKQEFIDKWSQ